jgi:hypothetical protein
MFSEVACPCYLYIVQSKIVTLLVFLTCTNGYKGGTTGWPAKPIYIWVQPTHAMPYPQIIDYNIILI